MSALSAPLQRAGLDAMKAGRLQEAIQYLDQARTIEPNAPETYTYLGVAYTQLGQWDAANHAFGHAVELEPGSAKARFNLGKVLQMEGQVDGARFCYQKAVELEPAYTQARDALAALPVQAVVETPAEPHSLTPAEVAALSAPDTKHMHLHGAQGDSHEKPADVKFEEQEQGIYSPI